MDIAVLMAKFSAGRVQFKAAPLLDRCSWQTSEYKLQGKLADARVLGRRNRAESSARKVGGGRIRVGCGAARIGEIRAVQNVEKFGAELQVDTFARDREVLEETGV